MSVVITASLGSGTFTLRNREIEHLEVHSKLGEPHRCTIRFDLDTNFTLALQDFQGPLTITIAGEDGSNHTVLFDGVMTGGFQDHQLRGGSRFEIRGASPLMLALERQSQPMQLVSPWDDVVRAFKLTVVGAPRFDGPAGGFRSGGGSFLDFVRGVADSRGFFVVERKDAVELHSEFVDDERRDLVWGLNLLAIRATSELVNHRFRGGVHEMSTKSDFRFRDQRVDPAITGAIALANAVKSAAPKFAVDQDPDYLLTNFRTTTKAKFRSKLQQESERTLGSAVSIMGESDEFRLKLGETIQTSEGSSFPLPGSVGVFGLVEISHIWNAAEYRNRFTASPWKNFSNATTPARQFMAGPLLAEVQKTTPEELSHGFLRVRLLATMAVGDNIGVLARLVSPFTGNQRGIVFVPEPHDEVLVDFAEGDPEHPYVIGSVWSPKDQCPGIEPKQIVTKNGNVLALHDDGWIELYTPGGQCMLQLSADSKGTPRLTLHSEGDLLLEAKGEIQITAASMYEKISGGVKRDIGGYEKVTIGKSLDLSVAEDLEMRGGLSAVVAGSNGVLTLTPTDARLEGSTTAVIADVMAIVSSEVVQLNPPVVPPLIQAPKLPPVLPDELATSWGKRAVPAETKPFDSGDDPPPG